MIRSARLFAAVAVALIGASASADNPPPAALSQAVSATLAARAPYAFDLEISGPQLNWLARYEPSASPALRLVRPRLDELNDDQRRAFERAARQAQGVSWCASESMGHISDVRLVREDAVSATYAFQPTRESIRSEQARAFADRLRGELTLTKERPDITSVRIFAPRGFSPAPLTRVDRLDISIACETAPNGRRYAAQTVSEVRGSALGQVFDQRTVQRQRNLSPAP